MKLAIILTVIIALPSYAGYVLSHIVVSSCRPQSASYASRGSSLLPAPWPAPCRTTPRCTSSARSTVATLQAYHAQLDQKGFGFCGSSFSTRSRIYA